MPNKADPKDVERLKGIVDKVQADRAQVDADYKRTHAREIAIAAEPHVQKEMHFYCRCHGDFVSDAIKVEFIDNYGQPCAYYQPYKRAQFVNARTRQLTFGQSCSRARRYITDKAQDPFFASSKMLARLRIEMADDLLQPGDERFNAVYGDPYKEANERLNAQERTAWQNNKSRY